MLNPIIITITTLMTRPIQCRGLSVIRNAPTKSSRTRMNCFRSQSWLCYIPVKPRLTAHNNAPIELCQISTGVSELPTLLPECRSRSKISSSFSQCVWLLLISFHVQKSGGKSNVAELFLNQLWLRDIPGGT